MHTPIPDAPAQGSPDRLHELCQQRWFLPDGQGGYAAGNAALLPDSPADGLLVRASRPPVGRFVLLSRLEESLRIAGLETPFSTQRYLPDVTSPKGYERLESFAMAPHPTWRYALGTARLERTVQHLPGRSLTAITYRLLEAEGPAVLTVRPFLPFRRIEEATIANEVADPSAVAEDGVLRFCLYDGLPALYLSSDLEWQSDPHWYRNFVFPPAVAPELRSEDQLSPGVFRVELQPGESCRLIAASVPTPVSEWPALLDEQAQREADTLRSFPVEDPSLNQLILRSQDFLVGDPRKNAGVLADLSPSPPDARATLLGLRGLTLIPGRRGMARQVLGTLSESYGRGLLPARMPEWDEAGPLGGFEPMLWFPVAVYLYLLYEDSSVEAREFVRRKLFWTLVEIGSQVQRGLPGLRMDRVDSLLVVGEDGGAHTWMNALDAQGVPVTPRRGKPVEINALWYNACEALSFICNKLNRTDLFRTYRTLAARIRETFPVTFWNPRSGCLYDVAPQDGASEEGRDDSVRPNQLWALALPFRLVDGDKAASILQVVERELLTPWGLRTLTPRSPHYVGHEIEGDDSQRHQGAVYPWLLGPFVDGAARLWGNQEGFGDRVRGWMERSFAGDPSALPGHLRERYDGDAPHLGRGATASALNTAEVLRTFVENVHEYPAFNMRPVRPSLGH